MSRASKLSYVLPLLLVLAAASRPAHGEEIAIGATAPAFELRGTDGKMHTLADITAAHGDAAAPKATVVVFTCNHCPYAKAYEPVLIDLAKKYAERGVAWVLINPNDPEIQPEDAFDKMVERAKDKGYPFPYLIDTTQSIAKAYGAVVTPHVFLVDPELTVRYRGRINDHKEPAKVETHDLVDALEAVLADREVATTSTKAFGCGIKWKKSS